MAERPARLAGLHHKGRIDTGCDADFAILDPDSSFVVDPARLHHRHPITPYAGMNLNGWSKQPISAASGRPSRATGRRLIARQSTTPQNPTELKWSA